MRRAPRLSPAWKWMAPQQPCSGGMKTSQPFCCKTRSVAQCVGRNMASATQPTKNATRARFRPTAGRNRGSFGPGFDRRRQQRNHPPQPAGDQLQAAPSARPGRTARPAAAAAPAAAACASARRRETAGSRINLAEPVVLLLRPRDRPARPPGGTARSAGRSARPRGRPSRTPGNPGTIPGAGACGRSARLRPSATIRISWMRPRGPSFSSPSFGIGRATRRAQPAVDAAQEQIVADSRGRVLRVVRVVGAVVVHSRMSFARRI